MICHCCDRKGLKVTFEGMQSIYSERKYAIAFCPNCGNGQTLPKPSQEELHSIYSSSYNYDAHLLIHPEKVLRAKGLARLVNRLPFAQGSKPIRLLEIGCMQGAFLEALPPGFQSTGVEIDPGTVEVARQKGLNVHPGSIEDVTTLSDEPFDVIVLSHVLEHLPDVNEAVKKIKQFLAPDGYLVIAVPNTTSFLRRIFGKHWGWWQVPVHINHFNNKALSQLLSSHALNPVHRKKRGGDSLMILLCFMNLLGSNKKGQQLTKFKMFIIRMMSFFLRYWYYAGDDELVLVSEKSSGKSSGDVADKP